MPVVTRFATTHAIVVTGWTNPLNAGADDNVYATSAPAKNATVNGDYGGFDFDTNIPTGSTINSVTATVGWFVSITTSVATLGLQTFVAGVAQGTETTNAAEPTTETTDTHVPTGLTRDNLLDANLKIRVRASRGNNNTAFTASLDYVKVAVDYTGPAQPLTAALTAGAAVTATGLSLLASEYYRFRDQFLTNDAAPVSSPRTAEPGPGDWTITGGSVWDIAARRLTIKSVAGNAWGSQRIVGPSQVRTNGRALVAVVHITDKDSPFALGWYPGDPTGDPRTDGHGWTNIGATEGGIVSVITPGVRLDLDTGFRNVRPIRYLVAVLLTDLGAAVLIAAPRDDSGVGMTYIPTIQGLPDFSLLHVDNRDGGDPVLTPYISSKESAFGDARIRVEDLRVIDVPSWVANDALATVADRIDRADSTTSMGGSWTPDGGTWGISANRAYKVSTGDSYQVTRLAVALSDGIFKWRVRYDSGTPIWRLVFRYVDSNNYLQVSNGSNDNIGVDKLVANVGSVMFQTAYTWASGTDYDITLHVKGNKYLLLVNGADPMGGWQTDAGNTHLTGTGIGIRTETNLTRVDNVAAYPLTIPIPAEILAGAKNALLTPESTLNNDTFTDTNGTLITAHTAEQGGAWTAADSWPIQSNALTQPAYSGADLSYVAHQAVTVGDYEATVILRTKASFVDVDDWIMVGLAVKVNSDATTYIYARCRMGTDQIGGDEIEIEGIVAGVPQGIQKVNIANYYTPATNHTLKARVTGDLLSIFLDGILVFETLFDTATYTGTRAGIYGNRRDTGTVFNSFQVQNLPLSVSIAAGAVVTANLSVGAPAHPLTAGLTADAVTTAALTVYHTLTAGLTADAVVGALGIEVGHAPTAGLMAGAVVGATALVTSHAMTLALTADAVVTASAITEAHAMALGLTADAVVSATRITEAHAMALGVTAGGVVTSDLTVGGAAAALTAALTAGAVVGASAITEVHAMTLALTAGAVTTANLGAGATLTATLTADAVVTATRITEAHAMTLGLTAGGVVGATQITESHAMALALTGGGVVGATSIAVGHAPTAGITADAVVGATRITESHAMALTLTADAVVGATRITESHAMTLGLTAGAVVGGSLATTAAALTATVSAGGVVGATTLTLPHALTLGLAGGAVVGATRLTEFHAMTLALAAGAVVSGNLGAPAAPTTILLAPAIPALIAPSLGNAA